MIYNPPSLTHICASFCMPLFNSHSILASGSPRRAAHQCHCQNSPIGTSPQQIPAAKPPAQRQPSPRSSWYHVSRSHPGSARKVVVGSSAGTCFAGLQLWRKRSRLRDPLLLPKLCSQALYPVWGRKQELYFSFITISSFRSLFSAFPSAQANASYTHLNLMQNEWCCNVLQVGYCSKQNESETISLSKWPMMVNTVDLWFVLVEMIAHIVHHVVVQPIQKHKPSCTERDTKVYFLEYLVHASQPLKRSEHAFIFLSCFVAFIIFKMKTAISLLISNLYLSPFVYSPLPCQT